MTAANRFWFILEALILVGTSFRLKFVTGRPFEGRQAASNGTNLMKVTGGICQTKKFGFIELF